MTLPPTEDSQKSETQDWLAILINAYRNGKGPSEWPHGSARDADWRRLTEDLLTLRQFIEQLTLGDLSAELYVKGQLAGSLKSFQANLRHLNWQVQQVAGGDLSQTVDFMGDFSTAFNCMIDNLRKSRDELKASEARYRLLAENAADVIWIMDLDGKFTYFSPSVQRLRGYTAEESLQQTIEESLSPASAQLVRQRLAKYTNPPQTGIEVENAILELEQTRKDGSYIWIETVTNPLISPDGTIIGIQGASRDITERRHARQAEHNLRTLAEAFRDTAGELNRATTMTEVFRSLLENISRVVPHDTVDILLVDSNGVAHAKASKGYQAVLPGKEKLVFELNLPVKQVPNLQHMVDTHLPILINDLDQYQWVHTESATWAKSHLGAPIVVKGKTEGFLILLSAQKDFFTPEHAERLQSFADQAAIAIEKAQLFQKLNELATIDSLTEIANRRHFFNQADIELARAKRYDRPLTALMVDIDYFKEVNDAYGHSMGDQVLQGVAQRCQRAMRKNDLLGRYGGEEFSVILPETHLPEGKKLAERLRLLISEQPFETLHGSINITISIGVASFHPGVASARALLDLADKALYQAKHAGRNRVVALE